jgi:ferrous iron transport protein B
LWTELSAVCGGVIVFLPNIVILYLFIAFMEDSGYMSRASFIMDKVMHKMGLHGKSFIPLIMGFGCNVPAIMSTRTIESRSSRMITMLIVPFMSCSARLPVYLVFVGIFFSKYASLVLLGLYVTGILLAVLSARLFRKTLFTEEDTPFVMELPPYRMPTLKSIIIHMWDRSNQYLKKMGGLFFLLQSLSGFWVFSRNMQREAAFDLQIETVKKSFTQNRIDEQAKNTMIADIEHIRMTQHQENSLIGQIGKFIEPVMRPLGFDWKISVSLLSEWQPKRLS